MQGQRIHGQQAMEYQALDKNSMSHIVTTTQELDGKTKFKLKEELPKMTIMKAEDQLSRAKQQSDELIREV